MNSFSNIPAAIAIASASLLMMLSSLPANAQGWQPQSNAAPQFPAPFRYGQPYNAYPQGVPTYQGPAPPMMAAPQAPVTTNCFQLGNMWTCNTR